MDAIRPEPAAPFAVSDTLTLQPGVPAITYINNQLEPLRWPAHLRPRPAPADGRGPGGAGPGVRPESPAPLRRPAARRPDLAGGLLRGRRGSIRPACISSARPRMTGCCRALRLSTAHVYYTYPFVLSWSLVEAMASAATSSARTRRRWHDAIEDGVNGRLLPFFDVEALSGAMTAACRDPAGRRARCAPPRARRRSPGSRAGRDARPGWRCWRSWASRSRRQPRACWALVESRIPLVCGS